MCQATGTAVDTKNSQLIYPSAPTIDQDTKASGSKASPALRVLIVEYYPDAAESLGILLRYTGYDFHICRDGREALASSPTYPANVRCS